MIEGSTGPQGVSKPTPPCPTGGPCHGPSGATPYEEYHGPSGCSGASGAWIIIPPKFLLEEEGFAFETVTHHAKPRRRIVRRTKQDIGFSMWLIPSAMYAFLKTEMIGVMRPDTEWIWWVLIPVMFVVWLAINWKLSDKYDESHAEDSQEDIMSP
jgi:hypothetical protein